MQGGEIKHFGTRPLHETPRQSKKKFVGALILFFCIVGGGYWLSTIQPIEIPEEEPRQQNEEVLMYFIETTQNRFVMLTGHPVEGFEPSMFIQAYPGLTPEDFDGVEALQGVYRAKDGEVFFEEFINETLHSAGRSISEIGMAHFFNNVMRRTGSETPTKELVYQTLLLLENQPSLEESPTEENTLIEEPL